MLNYYDELKNDTIRVLEENKEIRNILQSKDDKDTIFEELYDYLLNLDCVTGNASGSYYFSTYKARKHCYNFFRDVFEALENYGYNEELEKFKIFVALVEEGYLNIENMTLEDELLNGVDEYKSYSIFYEFEEIEGLNFETLDIITRCYMLGEVVTNVVESFLK